MLFDSFSWTKNHCKNWWRGFVLSGRGEAARAGLHNILVMARLPGGGVIHLADLALPGLAGGMSWMKTFKTK